jgi:hypothetical protein
MVCQHDGFVKMTIDLPADLVHAVKLRAVTERRPVKVWVAETLRVGLGWQTAGDHQEDLSGIEFQPDGLPAFRCRSDAPARGMTGEQLLSLEQQAQTEEDLQRAGNPA